MAAGRTIIHLDLDAFFCAVEQHDPSLHVAAHRAIIQAAKELDPKRST